MHNNLIPIIFSILYNFKLPILSHRFPVIPKYFQFQFKYIVHALIKFPIKNRETCIFILSLQIIIFTAIWITKFLSILSYLISNYHHIVEMDLNF